MAGVLEKQGFGVEHFSIVLFCFTEPFMVNARLQVNAISETSVDISWDKTECPPYDYTVDYTLVNLQGCNDTSVVTSIGPVAKDTDPSVTLDNLAPSSEYEVIVSSTNKDGHRSQLIWNFVTLASGEQDIEKKEQIYIDITYWYHLL